MNGTKYLGGYQMRDPGNLEIRNAIGPLTHMVLCFASIKYGGGVIQMSGSIAGNTYARNRFGNYVRPRTKPVNPSSTAQGTIRTILSFLAERWHDTLTPAERIAWGTYAAAVAMKNRLGEAVYLTGFNHYLRVNTVRMQMENSKCDPGPVTLTLPEKDPAFTVAAYASTQKLNIVHDVALPWCSIPASILGVWMGQPQGATRNFFGGPWKKVGPIPGNAVSPTLMDPPFTLIAGQKVWVYGRIATGPTDSRLSEPMVVSCTVLAAPP